MAGADELFTLTLDLRELAAGVIHDAKQLLDKTLQDIVSDGQAGSPVDTGFNRASITMESAYTAGGVEGEAGPESSYGGYLENGTSRMAPRPYMEPALDRRLPGFEAALEARASQL